MIQLKYNLFEFALPFDCFHFRLFANLEWISVNWSKANFFRMCIINNAVEPIYAKQWVSQRMFLCFWQIINNQCSNILIGPKGYVNWVNVIKSLNHRDYLPCSFTLKCFFPFRSGVSLYVFIGARCMTICFAFISRFTSHLQAIQSERVSEKTTSTNLLCENLAAFAHWNEIDCLQSCMSYTVPCPFENSMFGISLKSCWWMRTSTNLLNDFRWYLRHFDLDFNTHFRGRQIQTDQNPSSKTYSTDFCGRHWLIFGSNGFATFLLCVILSLFIESKRLDTHCWANVGLFVCLLKSMQYFRDDLCCVAFVADG